MRWSLPPCVESCGDSAAVRASSRVKLPTYRAVPMMAPSTPCGTSSARAPAMSSRVEIPPLATTGLSVRSQTCAQQVEVRAGQHAVGGDVGDHEAGAAGRGPAGQGLVQLTALPGPAAGGELACRGRPGRWRSGRRSSAMISSHHSGRSSAAVPMLTRAQPVASARSRVSSSRMPPDSSTLQPQLGGDLGDDLGVVAAAERGVQVDQVDPLRTGVLPALRRRPAGRRSASPSRPGPGRAGPPDRRRRRRPAAGRASEVVTISSGGGAPDDPI